LIMTMIRLGFVSNSSSSSFIIPKKILRPHDIGRVQEESYNTSHNEEIHETEHYFYGRINRENTLNELLKSHESDNGVEYYEG